MAVGSMVFSQAASAAVVDVAIASNHAMVVLDDGSLWSWGDDRAGALGNGPQLGSSQPEPVQISTGFSKVATGNLHTLAVKKDGTLWSWGTSSSGVLGLGQVPESTGESSPVQVGAGYKQVAAAEFHSLAVKTDGSLWAWGRTLNGQVGNGQSGSAAYVSAPVNIGSNYVKVVATTNYSLGIKADGTLWGWGTDADGAFGVGRSGAISRPVQINSDVKDVAASARHTLVVKTDG